MMTTIITQVSSNWQYSCFYDWFAEHSEIVLLDKDDEPIELRQVTYGVRKKIISDVNHYKKENISLFK